jgi:hypothetical protein
MKINKEILKKKLSSRKLWAAIIGFITSVGTAIGLPDIGEESMMLIVAGCAALCAYILGEGIADAGKGITAEKDKNE